MIKWLYQDDKYCIVQSTNAQQALGFGFNMGLHVGDVPSAVLTHRSRMLAALQGVGVQSLLWLNQVHGKNVYRYRQPSLLLPAADALVTDQRSVGLAIMTADCVPIALFDGQDIACIHAGWQGLVVGVIKETLATMGDSPKCAYIGASIGAGAYEVPLTMAKDVVGAIAAHHLANESVWQAVQDKGDGKAWLDVVLIARLQLAALGVFVINDDVDCTYTGAYHSHRRATHMGQPAGRMAMVIAKKS